MGGNKSLVAAHFLASNDYGNKIPNRCITHIFKKSGSIIHVLIKKIRNLCRTKAIQPKSI